MQLFVEVAACRSFSEAARRVGMSQPAVSQRIAALEGGLGVKLLDRGVRPPALTEAGSRYLEGCRGLLAEAHRLERAVRAVHARGHSASAKPLRLASIYSGGMEWLNRARSAFDNPAAVQLSFGSHLEVEAAVRDGDAELALVSFPEQIDRSGFVWAVEPLHAEPMVVVAPAGHPVAREPHLNARHLRGVELIGFDEALRVGRATLDYLRAHGVDTPLTHRFDNMDTLRAAVAATGHCAILPRPTVRDELAAGRLVAVELSPRFTRPLGLVAAADTLARRDVAHWIAHLRATEPPAAAPPHRPAWQGAPALAAAR